MHEDDEQQEQEIHLRDYLHVLQKRKWLVLAAVRKLVPEYVEPRRWELASAVKVS